MDKANVVTRVKQFLEQEFPSQGKELTPATNLLEDWFVDSFGIIEMVMFLETEFDLKIGRADINGENFRDINAIADFVSARHGA